MPFSYEQSVDFLDASYQVLSRHYLDVLHQDYGVLVGGIIMEDAQWLYSVLNSYSGVPTYSLGACAEIICEERNKRV